MTALIAFVIGWLAAGIIGWPYIKAGFDTGNPSAGVGRFIIVVFGVAIACGLVGMALGWIGGIVWEALHKGRRVRAQRSRDAAATAVASVARPSLRSAATPARASGPVRAQLPPLRFSGPELDAESYIGLATRLGATGLDRARIAAALAKTINVGAWDGDRLVGVARLLSDGYAFAALAEVFVDPELQRRGLGRELLNRAFERTPRGALLIGSPLASAAFFDKLGCERGPTGFTMRRTARQPLPAVPPASAQGDAAPATAGAGGAV